LVEGIFYAKLFCNDGVQDVEIDARTSDAIAIAVRFNCPIYTFEFILKSAGIVLDDETGVAIPSTTESTTLADVPESTANVEKEEYNSKSNEELKNMLQNAIAEEQYEMASKIRDELNKRKKS
jgi:bifunctional DNase/RNase